MVPEWYYVDPGALGSASRSQLAHVRQSWPKPGQAITRPADLFCARRLLGAAPLSGAPNGRAVRRMVARDYVWWQAQDRKVLKRINQLITDI